MKSLLFNLTLIATSLLCQAKQPNILIIFIDDLGWKDLGAYGSVFHETPHIDALSNAGVQFTNAYSAHPVCSPTRASLMTGKAPQRVGITQWIPQPSEVHLPHSEVTIAEAFQEAGYRTAYMGKWHLGAKDNQQPKHHGFDLSFAVNHAGQPGSFFFPYKGGQRHGIAYWDVPDFENGVKGDYLTDKLTDKAIDFIQQKHEKPFFLCLSHYAVHTPIQSPKPLVEKYQKKRHAMYGETQTPSIEEVRGTVSRGRQDSAAYAAMIENLDTNTGRILEALKKAKIDKETIIVFSSDNGGHCHLKKKPGYTSVLPLRSGKGYTYEGGIRVPTIITWEGTLLPQKVDTPIITMDFYATLLDLAGIKLKPQQHLDGLSLKNILYSSRDEVVENRFLAWSYPHKHGSGHEPSDAIREGDWKLIRARKDQSLELYNLKQDVRERQNLAQQHPELSQRLNKKLSQWLNATNAK